MGIAQHLSPIEDEFGNARLGDERRSDRLIQIATALAREPSESFPNALGGSAELEAFYRFVNNERFSAADILAPHRAATMARARESASVLAVHDTTYADYSTQREGFGYTRSRKGHGFVAHATLVLSEEGTLPLGIGHLETWTRTGTKWKKRKQGQRTKVQKDDLGRESLRWLRGVAAIEAEKSPEQNVIHVADAEGDFFELLAQIVSLGGSFVIRAGQLDRRVVSAGEEANLRAIADAITEETSRKVDLNERRYPRRQVGRKTRRRHPERSSRTARLAFGSQRVQLKCSKYSALGADDLEVTVVRVWEPKPAPGEPPVEWVLLTTEPCDTYRDVERIVDIYRVRWCIEEYFKALKTGCALEKRQLGSYDALCKTLALFAPIAYRMILLRAIERNAPDAPAKNILSTSEIKILRAAPATRELPPLKTVADALTYLAKLGGHIRNNGPPGWQTLTRGYEKLLLMRLGFELAHHGQKM